MNPRIRVPVSPSTVESLFSSAMLRVGLPRGIANGFAVSVRKACRSLWRSRQPVALRRAMT